VSLGLVDFFAMGDTPLRPSVAADLGSAASVLRELAAEPLPLLAPGTLIAEQFEVEALLGRGGMGAVYRAKDRALGRRVAIKLGLRGSDVARIQREGSTLARLAHPNVVTIFEIGSHDGTPFVAMELCAGGSLRGWLATPRPWRLIVERFVAVGQGLAAAHAAGIVHGDIKPDNILLGEDDRPRLADFGLATISGGDDRAGGGTPRYMAPELARGPATVASDQYAFAVALHEALAGADARAPRRIVAALARAMRAEPSARWPDVATLLGELQPPRRRWLAPVLAGGAVAVAAIAVVVLREPADVSDELRSVQPARCEGLPVDLDREWTPAQAATLRAAHPRGNGAARLLTDVIDHFAAEWTTARRRLCKELPTLPSWSPAIGDAGRTCLFGMREELRRLVALRDLEAAELVANVLALTMPASCAEPARLEATSPDPTVIRVTAEHDAIGRLRDQGQAGQALARARALVASLPSDAPPLAIGKANAVLGELLLAQVGLDASAAPTRTAFFAYRVAGSVQAFEPALRLVDAYTQTGQLELAEEWFAHATAEAQRVAISAMNRGALDLLSARLRSVRGDHAGALAAAEGALRGVDASTDPRRVISSLQIRSSLAIFLAELKRLDESVAVSRQVVAGREQLYGPAHSVLISDLFNIGLGELDLGHVEAARGALTRARTIADATLPPDAVLRGFALWNEGLAVGRTDRRAARALFDRALAIIVAAEGENSTDAVDLRADRARWSESS
jgi:tetratricopeptide (TPR) repeat protein